MITLARYQVIRILTELQLQFILNSKEAESLIWSPWEHLVDQVENSEDR